MYKLKKVNIDHEYMPYGSVLIVDDFESNRNVARGVMMSYGLSIDVAASGYETIEKISGGLEYDVIFIDYMMPKMDGLETTKKLREMGYKGTIVALTANALVGNEEMFTQHGFDGFISKPIDIHDLDEVIYKYIKG